MEYIVCAYIHPPNHPNVDKLMDGLGLLFKKKKYNIKLAISHQVVTTMDEFHNTSQGHDVFLSTRLGAWNEFPTVQAFPRSNLSVVMTCDDNF